MQTRDHIILLTHFQHIQALLDHWAEEGSSQLLGLCASKLAAKIRY